MKRKFSLMWRVGITLVLVLSLGLVTAVPASAAPDVTLTLADADIDADTFITGLYTDLPAIVIEESAFGEIGAGTIILNVPIGFEFRTVAPDVAVTGTGPQLAAEFDSITTTQLTITVTAASTSEIDNVLTIGGVSAIGVKPTQGTPLASGDIVMDETSTSAIAGVTKDDTSFGLLDEVHGALAAYTVEPAAGPYTAGTAFDVVITAVDQFGNPLGADYVTDEPYTWESNASAAPDATTPVIGTLVAADFTAGVATKPITLYAAESDVTFTITDASEITGTSAVITVDPEALAAYTVVPAALTQTAGTAFDVVITAVDEFENPLTTYIEPTAGDYIWTTTAGGTPVIGTLLFANFSGAGVATKSVTLDFIEPSVTFTATDTDNITGTSAGVAVVAGPEAYLVVTGDPTMTAGGTNELTVTAYDAAGNSATSYTGSKTLVFSGPGVAPDATAPTVEGVTMENETTVTFTAGVSVLGSATLIAYNAQTTTVDVTDGTVDSTGDVAYDLDLTVDPAAAAQLAYTAPPGSVEAGVETTAFTVERQDQYENPTTLGGALVVTPASTSTGTAEEFRAPSGSANVVETVTILADASTAEFYYYDEKAGAWTITASAGTLTAATAVLTVNPAGIDHYDVSAITSPQVVGAAFPVTIQAQDIFNNNVTGGTEEDVNITVTAGGTVAPTTTGITVAGAATVNVSLSAITLGQSITFTGASTAAGTSNPFQTVTYGAIDHYEIAVAVGPQTAGTPFTVTIQAKDAAGNDITLGDDIAETINVACGLADANPVVSGNTTAAGTASIEITLATAQAGQIITFTGATSGANVTTAAFSVYDVIMDLPNAWVLISTPLWISTDSAWDTPQALKYTSTGFLSATLADLKPVEALYVKMGSGGGDLSLIFSTGVQGVSAKELVAGWNLISSATSDASNARAVLAELQDVAKAGTGLTTVVSQGIYNESAVDFYVDATTWDNLSSTTLVASDGYWIRMNAGRTFGVVPVPVP